MFDQPTALANMLDKQPLGFAWTRAADSNWARVFTPASAEQVLFEEAAEAQLPEATPSTANELLADYERVLGPDPCLGPTPATLQQRRQSAHARWTEQGGASRQHYIDLAAKLGYAITIEEFKPSQAGQLRAGMRLAPVGVRFTWRVHAPVATPVYFRAGSSTAGQRLTTAAIPWLECNLRRRSPAHTTMIMDFDGSAPATEGHFLTDDQGTGITDDQGNPLTDGSVA